MTARPSPQHGSQVRQARKRPQLLRPISAYHPAVTPRSYEKSFQKSGCMSQIKMYLPDKARSIEFLELKCSRNNRILPEFADFDTLLCCLHRFGKHAKFVTSFILFCIETILSLFIICFLLHFFLISALKATKLETFLAYLAVSNSSHLDKS